MEGIGSPGEASKLQCISSQGGAGRGGDACEVKGSLGPKNKWMNRISLKPQDSGVQLIIASWQTKNERH